MQKHRLHFLLALVFFTIACLYGCNRDELSPFLGILVEGEEYAGGETTVFDVSRRAFDRPAANRSSAHDFAFIAGNAFFRRNWVTAPASSEGNDGLGPVFNSRACIGCHVRDGRGSPPINGSTGLNTMLLRLSLGVDANGHSIPVPQYGTQFNNQAIFGLAPEGKVEIDYTESTGQYPDGEIYTLRAPTYRFTNLGYGEMPGGVLTSPRTAPFIIGLGLLEAIAEEDLLALEDPTDANGDGISGKANYVWDVASGSYKMGRFGWKANQPSVRQQVAGAFNGDIGMTTSMFPQQPCGPGQVDCENQINGGDPELSDVKLNEVVFYTSMIAVPGRRNWNSAPVLEGKSLFLKSGCGSCHRPSFITSNQASIAALAGQRIFPYTDLLLHDMGPALADNRPDFEATGKEWRTPPLWGIGLVETVNDHTNFLHDGRARNLEEAILWHGGEAEASKLAFMNLSKDERTAFITFLNSL